MLLPDSSADWYKTWLLFVIVQAGDKAFGFVFTADEQRKRQGGRWTNLGNKSNYCFSINKSSLRFAKEFLSTALYTSNPIVYKFWYLSGNELAVVCNCFTQNNFIKTEKSTEWKFRVFFYRAFDIMRISVWKQHMFTAIWADLHLLFVFVLFYLSFTHSGVRMSFCYIHIESKRFLSALAIGIVHK